MGHRTVDQLWSVDKGEEEWLHLIGLIDPGCEAVEDVIAQAKAKAPNGEFPAYVAQEGEDVAELVNAQVKAIYEALRERKIGYAVERWDSRPPAQVIRTHEEILDSDGIGGPCIDLVVLMAACLEAVGIQPLVIVLEERKSRKRHAILGHRLEELRYGPETPADQIPPLLSKQELDRLKNAELVEFINCTGITRGENVDFEEARDQGNGYVKTWDLIFALDVKVARHTALTREMQEYLERVRDDVLALPPAFGFPPGRNFREIRVQVKVRKGPRRYSEAEARAREMSRRQGLTDEESIAKAYQYPWPLPEELDREREAERPLDWDRQVRGRLKRAVILGDPGFGKTWLLKHEALKLAEEALDTLEEYPLATQEVRLPIFLPLAQLAAQADEQGRALPMEKALLAVLAERYPVGGKLKQWIKENLNSERCVLLLDALDEVPSDRKEALCERLAEFVRKHDRTPILLTSRLVGYPGPPFPLPPDGELELLPFDRRQQREFVRKWFEGEGEKAEAFLRGLRESPQLQALARVPLLLALMCRLFAGRGELPKSRVELYEACVWGILTRRWKTPRSGDDPYLDAKLELLEEVAFQLFLEEKELFSLRDLRTVIEKILKAQSPLARDLKEKPAAELVRELEDDGILIKAGAGEDPPFLFLHLTFQEYLAACALLRRIRVIKGIPEWLRIAQKHFWDPGWEGVVRLLAAKLKDATPLIKTILRERDDLFNTLLFLAAKCAADASHVDESLRSKIINKLISALRRQGLVKEVAMLCGDSLTAIGGKELVDKVILDLSEQGAFGQSMQLMTVTRNRLPTDPEHLSQTLQQLSPSSRQKRVEALIRYADFTGDKQLKDALISAQQGTPYSPFQAELRKIAAALAATALSLFKQLRDESLSPPERQDAAKKFKFIIRALPWIQLEREDQEVIPVLLKIVNSDASITKLLKEVGINLNLDILQQKAIKRLSDLSKIAETEVCEEVFSYLLRWLRDASLNLKLRIAAAQALGEFRDQKATPLLLQILENETEDLSLRIAVTQAIGVIKDPKAIPVLLSILKDPAQDDILRAVAARTLGRTKATQVVPDLLQVFEEIPLSAPLRAATRPLGRIMIQKKDVICRARLHDYRLDLDIRIAIMRALGEIRDNRAVDTLLRILRKDSIDWRLRAEAAFALGNIGDPRAILTLRRILDDRSSIPKVRITRYHYANGVPEGAPVEMQRIDANNLEKAMGLQNACYEALKNISVANGKRIYPGRTVPAPRTLSPVRLTKNLLIWQRENEDLIVAISGFAFALISWISSMLGWVHIRTPSWWVILLLLIAAYSWLRSMAKLGWFGKGLAARLWWREGLLNQRLGLHALAAKCFKKAHHFDPRYPVWGK